MLSAYVYCQIQRSSDYADFFGGCQAGILKLIRHGLPLDSALGVSQRGASVSASLVAAHASFPYTHTPQEAMGISN
jgi:hypothetical protein